MANSFWWVSLVAGLEDGANPCLLMTAAVVLLVLLWFKRLVIRKIWFSVFLGTIVLNTCMMNSGLLDQFILTDEFQIVARWIYGVLAIVTGFKGIKYLSEWYRLVKGKVIPAVLPIEKKFSPFFLFFMILLAGFFLSLLAAVWPVNYYILVFGMYMAMPGQGIQLASLIFLYTMVSLWIVYLMVWMVFLENKNQRLFKMMAAAILLSASLGIINVIFMKGYSS